jgi:hypothetical protein
MSYVGDALSFEKFHLKDLWDRLRQDPKRLVLGVDPWSTKLWNGILGRHDKPLVDQMGGAYGGNAFSVGQNPSGGVYGRAQEAGINTGPGMQMQQLAHIVSAAYAAGGLGGMGGSSGGSAGASSPATSGGWQSMAGGMPQMGQPQQQRPVPNAYIPSLLDFGGSPTPVNRGLLRRY